MIDRLKLYFDVCCSTRLPTELLAFYGPHYPLLETRHLLQDHKGDCGDSDWLRPIREDGWVPVTCDRGRDKKKERLPLICKEWKITHIAFSSTLLNKGPTAQKNAIGAVWEELFHLDQYPAGSQMRLGEAGTSKSGAIRYALRVKDTF